MSSANLEKWATWSEIIRQPTIWTDWAKQFDPQPVRDWIAQCGAPEIWLTGAGTSAYIGDIAASALEGRSELPVRAVASTDIVSRPRAFLAGRNPLVVSFGRSGSSAESLGVLDALDTIAPDAARLNITCNGSSALATRPARNRHVIVLPEATHDTGFAMTSSFSTMLMTVLATLDSDADLPAIAAHLASSFGPLVDTTLPLAGPPPERIVFLGTGPLAYAAREAALKVMELSAGQIPALWDSTLGFRHGPKSFVTPGTRLVLFHSSEPHARRYEDDLAEELARQFPDASLTLAGPGAAPDFDTRAGDGWNAILAVVLAQVLGVVWSDALSLNVDDPFKGRGTLTRVVADVKLYEVAR